MELRLATFNIRHNTDRYDERRPLLVAAFEDLRADICGLQECVLGGDDRQDDLLAATRSEPYLSFSALSPRWPVAGNAILCGAGQVLAHEQTKLGYARVAQRILVALPGQRTLWFANTHLHHKPEEPEIRAAQARSLCAWLAEAPPADAMVMVGDFNTPPHEPAYSIMVEHGLRSAFNEANGAEPSVTWPSGIQAATMDTDGPAACLDYIWIRGAMSVQSAVVMANQPAPRDATLYPSDHFALVASVTL